MRQKKSFIVLNFFLTQTIEGLSTMKISNFMSNWCQCALVWKVFMYCNGLGRLCKRSVGFTKLIQLGSRSTLKFFVQGRNFYEEPCFYVQNFFHDLVTKCACVCAISIVGKRHRHYLVPFSNEVKEQDILQNVKTSWDVQIRRIFCHLLFTNWQGSLGSREVTEWMRSVKCITHLSIEPVWVVQMPQWLRSH